MDISAPSPISAQATAAAHNALREPTDVTKVSPSNTVSDARADPHAENGHGQSDRAAEARQVIANRKMLRDPSTPTGPSPTFQITLLEVEQDLQNILARIEAARAKERDAGAVKPDETGSKPVETQGSDHLLDRRTGETAPQDASRQMAEPMASAVSQPPPPHADPQD